MKRLLLLVALFTVSMLTVSARNNIYKVKVVNDAGEQVSLRQYKGKVLLIVNTATRCGFTPQYKELEALYAEFSSRGLEILDFPCNQFGEQAPGSIEEIHSFCTANFDIHFPQFDKIDVNGPQESPLFTLLKKEQPFKGFDQSDKTGSMMHQMMLKRDEHYAEKPDIKWNFTKFLVDRKGNVVRRFEPTESMADVKAAIEALL